MTKPVMVYVQHLLGIGHVMRVCALVRALGRLDQPVVLLSGGPPTPMMDAGNAQVIQLPPCHVTDKSFKPLLDETNNPVDDAWRDKRKKRLLEIFESVKPGALVVELFPFGRRQFRFELLPLLEAAISRNPRPRIFSSVRDILVEKKKPERNQEIIDWVNRYFDEVLVHGDPRLVPFERTFPQASHIRDRIRYTGYVVDTHGATRAAESERTGEVIVSAGGGGVGENLLRTAIQARPMSVLSRAPWRLLVGHNLPDTALDAIAVPDGVTVERARPDFAEILARAALSISQGGYNTVMEILATGVPSVIVPFAEGKESEQTLRAGLLARRGLIHMVEEAALSPETLARAVNAAAQNAPMGGTGGESEGLDLDLDLGGAEASARLIAQAANSKK